MLGTQSSFFEVDKSDIVVSKPKTRSRSVRASTTSSRVLDCSSCGLSKHCKNPKMKRYGKNRLGILIVGLCPGKQDDQLGVPLTGTAGGLLSKQLGYLGINIDQDCVRTNIVTCFKDKNPTNDEISACRTNLLKDIEEVKPKLIICLGEEALNAILDVPQACNFSKFNMKMMHGRVVPSHKFNCWVVGTYLPSFFLYRKKKDDVPDDENMLAFDLAKAVSMLNKPLVQPLTKEGNILLDTMEKVVDVLGRLGQSKRHVAYDYETTHLSPYSQNAYVVSASYSDDVSRGYFVPLNVINPKTGKWFFEGPDKDIVWEAMRDFLRSPAPKGIQNNNMEELWNRVILKQSSYDFENLIEEKVDGVNHIYDTMVGAHVLNGNAGTTGLAFQVFEMTGHDYKCMVDASDMARAPFEAIFHYNTWDARYTRMALDYQIPQICVEENFSQFSWLFQQGAFALLNCTERGISISEKEMKQLEDVYLAEAARKYQEMKSCKCVPSYEQYAKKPFNPESPQQIGTILYKYFQINSSKGKKSTDIVALDRILEETKNEEVKKFVSAVQRHRKCTSLLKRATNYRGLVDKNWYVHPQFNLNVVDTFRSSAQDPSVQNIFKRDKELKKFRRVIRPTPGNILLEADYDSMEVRVIAMDSQDPELTRQIVNGVDTHRRWGTEIFMLPADLVTEDLRFQSKNSFVFASFYGAIWETIAPKFPTCSKEHIRDVQAKFWREFQGVKEWQNRNILQYQNTGYVEGLSGYKCYGPLNINKICNYPIQGTAFHLLLDSFIRIEKEFAKRKLRSKVLFEVHDSLTLDVVIQEIDEVIEIVTSIMVSKRFDWQGNVPVSVSWEVGKSCWFDLVPIKFEEDEKLVKIKNGKIEEWISLVDYILHFDLKG